MDFYNRIDLFYSLVKEDCNAYSCPSMTGGPKYEYLWQDGHHYKVNSPYQLQENFTNFMHPSCIINAFLMRSKQPQSIQNHPKASKSILEHPKVFKSIQKHPKASKSIQEHPKASEGIQKHSKAFKSIQRHPKASKSILKASSNLPQSILKPTSNKPQSIPDAYLMHP